MRVHIPSKHRNVTFVFRPRDCRQYFWNWFNMLVTEREREESKKRKVIEGRRLFLFTREISAVGRIDCDINAKLSTKWALLEEIPAIKCKTFARDFVPRLFRTKWREIFVSSCRSTFRRFAFFVIIRIIIKYTLAIVESFSKSNFCRRVPRLYNFQLVSP